MSFASFFPVSWLISPLSARFAVRVGRFLRIAFGDNRVSAVCATVRSASCPMTRSTGVLPVFPVLFHGKPASNFRLLSAVPNVPSVPGG
jgi:hypothetical protein